MCTNICADILNMCRYAQEHVHTTCVATLSVQTWHQVCTNICTQTCVHMCGCVYRHVYTNAVCCVHETCAHLHCIGMHTDMHTDMWLRHGHRHVFSDMGIDIDMCTDMRAELQLPLDNWHRCIATL